MNSPWSLQSQFFHSSRWWHHDQFANIMKEDSTQYHYYDSDWLEQEHQPCSTKQIQFQSSHSHPPPTIGSGNCTHWFWPQETAPPADLMPNIQLLVNPVMKNEGALLMTSGSLCQPITVSQRNYSSLTTKSTVNTVTIFQQISIATNPILVPSYIDE